MGMNVWEKSNKNGQTRKVARSMSWQYTVKENNYIETTECITCEDEVEYIEHIIYESKK